MIEYFSAKIRSNDRIGEHVRYLSLHPEKPLPYQAGQFFLLRLRAQNGDYVERSYSASNWSSSGDFLEFVIRLEPGGQMSMLIDRLKSGESCDIKGPFGQFGTLPEEFKRLVLIAGGVGIAPLRSMLQSLQDHAYPSQLFFGFRTPDDFLFKKELQSFKNLEIIAAISEKGFPEWKGLRGYISDCLEGKIFSPDDKTHAFLCGPPLMVKATREKLHQIGFERKHIHLEAW